MNNVPGIGLDVIPSKRTFWQGEMIALTLRFKADMPGLFGVSNASYDRSGRLSIDRFHLDRSEDTTDPLADYYRASGGYLGGGLSAVNNLDTTIDVPIVLNEWFRFDRPGTYRLYVTSRRLYPYGDITGQPLAPVTSTIAQFEIAAADPAWAASALADASARIDRIAAQLGGWVVSYAELRAVQDELEYALRVLRFLGTSDAACELVRHLALDHGRIMWQPLPGAATPRGTMPAPAPHDRTFELIAGLFGSPHRALVISEMELRMTPDGPVGPELSRTLDLLHKVR
jgi:hypothetical protein